MLPRSLIIVKYFFDILTSDSNCVINCCLDHGIPQPCLEEEDRNMSVSSYNNTHHIVKIIHSNECNRYSKILEECKLSCA